MYRVYVSGPEEYIIEYIHKNQCTKTINLQNVYYIPKKKRKKNRKTNNKNHFCRAYSVSSICIKSSYEIYI